MARLQILELPEGAGDERPPFALVIDQADDLTIQAFAYGTTIEADGTQRPTHESLKAALGARAVLVFEDAIDIPANADPAPPGRYPYSDGDVTVLGPEIFASSDGTVISWKGENYTRQGGRDAIERVYQLHAPVDYNGRTICAECSAYDLAGRTTDNAPVNHDQCATLRAIAGTTP